MTDVDRNTIASLLLQTGDRCAEIMDRSMRNPVVKYVQADEIWRYVGEKDKRIRKDDSPEMKTMGIRGNGCRNQTGACLYRRQAQRRNNMVFVNELAERVSTRIQLTTDGCVLNRHVEEAFGTEVDFAQLIKLYGQ